MTRIALVTAAAARDLDDDLPPLVAALREAGADTAVAEWDDAAIDWSRFDFALLRSTWDYTQRPAEFLAWIDRAAKATTIANPPAVVRWNSDKHYLADLAHAHIPIVSSTFVEPGDDPRAALSRFVDRCKGEFVVKPSIGAGSRDAQRYARDEIDAAAEHAKRLLDANRSVLLQPYLDRVDSSGETALIFFDGAFSHAIRKGPLLRRGESPTRALFATEHITPREPDAAEIDVASRTLAAIPFDKPLLYARVDLIRDDAGAPHVLELELTEPSLFFAHAPGSAQRFARAIVSRTNA
jgi:O-ureido-D-serine cyclo-ligase